MPINDPRSGEVEYLRIAWLLISMVGPATAQRVAELILSAPAAMLSARMVAAGLGTGPQIFATWLAAAEDTPRFRDASVGRLRHYATEREGGALLYMLLEGATLGPAREVSSGEGGPTPTYGALPRGNPERPPPPTPPALKEPEPPPKKPPPRDGEVSILEATIAAAGGTLRDVGSSVRKGGALAAVESPLLGGAAVVAGTALDAAGRYVESKAGDAAPVIPSGATTGAPPSPELVKSIAEVVRAATSAQPLPGGSSVPQLPATRKQDDR